MGWAPPAPNLTDRDTADQRGGGTASWQVAAGLELEFKGTDYGEMFLTSVQDGAMLREAVTLGSHNSIDTTTRLLCRAQLLPSAPMVMLGIPPECPHLFSPLPSLGFNNPDLYTRQATMLPVKGTSSSQEKASLMVSLNYSGWPLTGDPPVSHLQIAGVMGLCH